VWAACAIFALVALGTYGWLASALKHSTQDTLAGYHELIKLAPRPAYVTITLP
jgi:type VI secretion system protein ImpK